MIYVITWHAEMTYKNIKTNYNKSCDIWERYNFICTCITAKFGDHNLCESFNITFLIYHVITRTKVMSPNGYTQFHPSHQIWFTCLSLLKSASGITKCDSYYKVSCNTSHKLFAWLLRILIQFNLEKSMKLPYRWKIKILW